MSFNRRNTFSERELAKKREWIQKMKNSLQNSKHDHFMKNPQNNNHKIDPSNIKKKKEFSTQKISRKKRSMASETSPDQHRINVAHKTGSYYQRLRKNNIESEQKFKGNPEYQQFEKIKDNISKYSNTRISRSTIVNKPTQDGTAQGSGNMSSSQNKISYNAVKQPRKPLRDFSTGVVRKKNDQSLITSNDITVAHNMYPLFVKFDSNNNPNRSIQSKSVYDKSNKKQRLPQIIPLDSKQYKSKLLKVESRTNTGLNLTNEK